MSKGLSSDRILCRFVNETVRLSQFLKNIPESRWKFGVNQNQIVQYHVRICITERPIKLAKNHSG